MANNKKNISQVVLSVNEVDPLAFFGQNNSKFNIFKEAFPELKISNRGRNIKIYGQKKQVQRAKQYLETMIRHLKEQKELNKHTIKDVLAGDNPMDYKLPANDANSVIVYGRNGKPIKAKTKNQNKLVQATRTNDIVFAVGPAGTGKTYTAVALAVQALRNKIVQKIILTRPAVEAGENLGFLPGDLKEKIDPYLRPLYDALDDMLPLEKLNYFMANRIIEIAPLAFMRGRTLDKAFVILDEAQNATIGQIKMFLTRLGPSAKYIVTGDLSQIDLPHYQRSGLHHAIRLLGHLDGIETVTLTASDVVRHRLVKQIILEFEKDGKRTRKREQSSEEE